MKVEVKKVDNLKRELRFEVPKDRVAKVLDDVYKDLEKTAKVKGFRQGKVPRHILESQHGKVAQEEMIRKLVPEVYQEGVDQEKIAPIDIPEILDVQFKDGIVTFAAKLEIKPEIKIKDYKGIKVNRKSSQVSDEDLNKTLEFFKKGPKGDENLTVDDDFARSLGYPNLEDFKKTISKQMELEKDRQSRIDVENQIVEHLLAKSKLTVPKVLVKRQFEHRLAELKNQFKSQGLNVEDINKRVEEMKNDLQISVERDVKVFLIMDKIAQLESIQLQEKENLANKVMAFLLKEAKWEGDK